MVTEEGMGMVENQGEKEEEKREGEAEEEERENEGSFEDFLKINGLFDFKGFSFYCFVSTFLFFFYYYLCSPIFVLLFLLFSCLTVLSSLSRKIGKSRVFNREFIR